MSSKDANRSPGDKHKYSATTPAATTSPSPHPSWGTSSRIERGLDHVGSEMVLGNVPEDDCLSTSGQFSLSSTNTVKGGTNVNATNNSTAQPSSAEHPAGHDRERGAEDSQPSRLSADDVQLPGPARQCPEESFPRPAQQPQEQGECRPDLSAQRSKASSGPLQPTGAGVDIVTGAPLHRSHAATVKKLDVAIEKFGKEKQGYDLVGVAQAMVGFEKMVVEEAERVRYNSIRLQAIEMRPESAPIFMNMEKEDWNALNAMTPPAARKCTSLNVRSEAERISSRTATARTTTV